MTPDPTDDLAERAAAADDQDRAATPEEAQRDRALMRGTLSAGPPRDQDRAALELCARVLRTWPNPLDAAEVDGALDAIAFSLGWTVFAGGHAEARRRHAEMLAAQRVNDARRDLPGLAVPPPGENGLPANRLARIERLELAFNVLRSAHGERLERLEQAAPDAGN